MDLLTLQETMQKLNKSDSTIRRMMKRGKLPYQKIHGRYYFHVSDVNKHLPSQSSNDEVIRGLSNRISRLELEVEELKQRLEQMTMRSRINENPPVDVRQVNTPPTQIKAPEPHFAAISELPEGTLHFHDWLVACNLLQHRRKILKYLTNAKHGLLHEAYEKVSRPGEYDRYLTPEQQGELLQWLYEHHQEVFGQ